MRDFLERHALALVSSLAVAGLTAAALVASITDASAGDVSAYGLLVVAIAAVVLALWRNLSSQRQAAATGRQAETTHREALDSRLQRGADMLISEHPAMYLAGVYLLESLAADHPDAYAELVDEMIFAAEELRRSDG